MSTIRKKPYIETKLGSLSTENIASLVSLLNNGGNNLSCGFDNLPNDTIKAVYFQLDANNHKSGILIKNSSTNRTLIAYNRFQELQLYDLDVTNKTYKKIDEYCDINELRRIVNVDTEADVKAIIDSHLNVERTEDEELQFNDPVKFDEAITDGNGNAYQVVEANPSGSASTTLTKIKIGSTNYSMGGGSAEAWSESTLTRSYGNLENNYTLYTYSNSGMSTGMTFTYGLADGVNEVGLYCYRLAGNAFQLQLGGYRLATLLVFIDGALSNTVGYALQKKQNIDFSATSYAVAEISVTVTKENIVYAIAKCKTTA